MNTVIKQTLFYGVGLVVMKGVSFIMLPVITGYLPAEEYGRLDVLVTLMSIGSIVVGFGLVEAIYRHYGFANTVDERKAIVASGFTVNMLLAITLLALALPFISLLGDYLPGDLSATSLTLALLNISVGGMTSIPLAWLRINDQAQRFFAFTTSKAVFQGVTTFALLELGWGINGVLWSGLLANVILMIALTIFQYTSTGFTVNTDVSKKLLTYGLPLVFSGICVFISSGLERWVLAGYADTASLATYGVAAMFSLVVAFLVEPFTLWWYPKRFEYLGRKNGREYNAYYSSIGVSLSMLAAMLMTLIGPFLITHMLPQDYHGAASILPILALAMAIKQSAHLMNVGCFSGGSTALPTKINIALAIISLFVYPYTALSYQAEGIVVGVLIINVCRWCLFFYFSQNVVKLAYPLSFLARQLSCLLLVVIDCVGGFSAVSVGAMLVAIIDSARFIRSSGQFTLPVISRKVGECV